MTARIVGFLCIVVAAAFLHADAAEAEAARLGGKTAYAYTRGAPAPKKARLQGGSYAEKPGQTQKSAVAPRGGTSGVLAGIMAGSFLGALLFGGAHEGVGVVDMALLAFFAFLALKLLRAVALRRARAAAARGGKGAFDPWSRSGEREEGAFADSAQEPDITLLGFDAGDFLRGAKALFVRLQGSWDKRDLSDIASFVTPAVLEQVEAQADEEPGPSVTEILLVNASLVAAKRDGDNDAATVFFDALVREDPKAKKTSQARELWRFIRPAGSSEMWRLDGIQRVS